MNGSRLIVGLFGLGGGSALLLLRHRLANGYLRSRLFLADVLGGPVRLMFRPAPDSGWEKFLRRWPYIIAWTIGPLWILMGLGALAEFSSSDEPTEGSFVLRRAVMKPLLTSRSVPDRMSDPRSAGAAYGRCLVALALAAVIGNSGCGGGGSRIVAPPPEKRGLLPAPSQLSDRVLLDRDRVAAGTPVQGTLEVVNRGRRSVKLLTHGCGAFYGVELTNGTIVPMPAFTAQCVRPLVISPGANRLPVSVSTRSDACSQEGARVTASSPACLPGARLPPLPAGAYRAVLIGTGLALPDPPPVTVVLTTAQAR